MTDSLKIASWNINSVRARTLIVEQFLREQAPDILCLQETKVCDADFPAAMFHALGYRHLVICGQRMHHGVAIISRIPHSSRTPMCRASPLACQSWRSSSRAGRRLRIATP